MKSQWGSQALAVGLRPGARGGPESRVTSLAGFETVGWSGDGSLADWVAPPGSGVTPLAGFAGGRRPQAPGGRTAMPAAFK